MSARRLGAGPHSTVENGMNHRHTLMGLILASAVAFSAMPTAEATSLADLSEDQITDAATYIVRGKILDVWTEVDERGLVWTRASVDVQHTYKGPDSPDFLVVDAMGGVYGERQMMVPASARYSVGEDVLLFLDTIDFGRKLATVGMYLGKYTLRRAPGDARPHVMRWTTEEADYDGRFLPHPAPERRVYADDLIGRGGALPHAGRGGRAIPRRTEPERRKINTPQERERR